MMFKFFGLYPIFPQWRRKHLSLLLPPALAILSGLACSSQSPHLIARDESRQAGEAELTTERLLPSHFTDDKATLATDRDATPATSGLSPADRPGISRLQKPDGPPVGQPERGSLLDLVSYQTTIPGGTETAARIRATVNGVAILDEEVREAVYPYLVETQKLPANERPAAQKKIFEAELQHIIEREIILQDAFGRLKERPLVMEKFKEAASKEFDKKVREMRKRFNIKSDEEFKAWLQAQGLTPMGIRRQMERQFMAQEYMRSRVMDALDRVTLQQVQEYYRQHPEEFQIPDSVTWNDIFIDAYKFPSRDAARQFADKILAKARAGEDFLKMVTQYDNGDSSYRNGEGYGHLRGEIKPVEAEAILFKMQQAGEIGPLIELSAGFHVIRLVKRDNAGLKPFDHKTQTAILGKLKTQVFEVEYKKVLAELKRNSTIEISSSVP